jgi:transcriptional regulator with XRE-family HTH domain
MTNQRLRGQIAAQGLTPAEVATSIGVDPKTVERWITTDRTPYRRHRWAIAQLLDSDEAYLWPAVLNDPQTISATQAEFVTLYPHRGAVPEALWNTLVDSTKDCLDVLVFAGLFFVDSRADLPTTLETKAARGTKTRILLGDPDSSAVAQRADEEGIGHDLAARIKLSLNGLSSLVATPGVDIRLHSTPLYNSMYRFDDDLLVNTHVYGSQAPHSPVLHLKRVPGGRLFDHYMQSFDRVWNLGSPVAS